MSIDVILEAVHPEDRDRAGEAFALLVKMDQNLDIGHFRVVRPDWAVRHPEISSEIERKPDGAPVRAHGIVHDVTERRNAEEMHRQLALELARMSGRSSTEKIATGLVRDLKPPLAAIAARAHEARSRLASTSGSVKGADEAFDFVLQQAMMANATVEKVRQVIGKETNRRAVDLNEIIRDAIDLVRREADITVDLDLAGNLPRVTADPVQIAQVVIGLARNCIEAMAAAESPQWALRVGTGRRNGRRVWFQVEGTGVGAGIGISSAARDHLFYPYVSTKPGELGSGLLICQHIVEAHAGEFSIGDKMEGGVVASFTLPIAEGGQAA